MLIILILLVSNVNVAANSINSAHSITPSSVSREYWPTQRWQNTTPEEQGMDSSKLQEMVNYIDEENIHIDSVIVIRHGYIVLEEYPNVLYNENRSHYWYSVTKSFTSSLIGIALDKGYIDNVSQKVLSFFPERTIENWDDRKDRITLEHLLAMRSGIFWDEWSAPFTSPENGIYHLMNRDGVQYVLELNITSEPGTEWFYNTGASHLLSAIVQQTSGLTALDFGREYLFSPLGIENVFWPSDASGVTRGGFDLYIRPRDAAKFGYLFLNNGTWDGTQILSHDWVNASSCTISRLDVDAGYGYQWWTNPEWDYYFAAGLNGQYIFVVPGADLVVVFSSTILQDDYPHEHLLQDYILASITNMSGTESELNPFIIPILVACIMPVVVIVLYLVHKTRIR
jgi:CubicO group peptidase (beta-lactamase class C family)